MIITTGPKATAQCVTALHEGHLVGLPTETVYGLAADATQDEAVASIFQVKGRPQFNPLILHSHSIEILSEYALFDERALDLARRFWPGPLTLVLPRKADSELSLLTTAGLDTVAVRIPAHVALLEVLQAFGKPVAAPSANLSGQLSPTCVQDVEEAFGNQVAYVLDGGKCTVGVESTILDLTGDSPVLLRPGGLPLEILENLIGTIHSYEGTTVKSPGMLASHYAPSRPVRINVTTPHEQEAYLGFGPSSLQTTLNLSPTGDLKEAAAHLFSMMRQLDQKKFSGIAIAPIPEENLGRAINDRIRRAAIPG